MKHPCQILAPFMCRWWWFWEDVAEYIWPGNEWYPSSKWEDYLAPSQALIDAAESLRIEGSTKFMVTNIDVWDPKKE